MNEDGVLTDTISSDIKREKKYSFVKFLLFLFFGFLSLTAIFLLFFFGTGYGSTSITEKTMIKGREHPSKEEAKNSESIINSAKKEISSSSPTKTFIVIDRIHNRLWLYEDGEKTLEAKISAGAGSILKDPKTQREWTFDTPTGRYKVRGKRERPLWTAPDWEFIEANEPFPKNYADRTEEGMLGEYALDLDIPGYMIHGTLYERLIGRNVTHGCVRVGRDDLRILWKKVPIGSTVFIF